MKFLGPNYSCLQNRWLRGYRPQIPVLSDLCPQLNLLNTPPTPKKIPGYATHYITSEKSKNNAIRGKVQTAILCVIISRSLVGTDVSEKVPPSSLPSLRRSRHTSAQPSNSARLTTWHGNTQKIAVWALMNALPRISYYNHASLKDWDKFWEMCRQAISSLCERHRVYVHKPR